MANLVESMIHRYSLRPGDRRLQLSQPGPDFFLAEILVTLCSGATLVIPERRGAPDAEGNLVFTGRRDEQVKLRGHRVQLGDVQRHLSRAAGGAAAVAFVTESAGRSRLVGVVESAGRPQRVEAILESLRRQVKDVLVPSRIMLVERLPRLASGKVDRELLKHRAAEEVLHAGPGSDHLSSPGSGEAAGPTHLLLARIWTEVLGVTVPSVQENFFDLGGNSLLAVSVATHVRESWGGEVSVRDLFECPTIAALARRVDRRTQPWPTTGTPPRDAAAGAPAPSADASTLEEVEPLERILARQRPLVRAWKGRRLSSDSFVVTLNHDGQKPGLYWCFQDEAEHRQLAAHLGPDQPGADPDAVFRACFPAGFAVSLVEGVHGQYFDDANVSSLAAAGGGHLARAVATTSR